MKEGGAAKGELVLAMYELANSFRHGWGVEKDPIAARSYYETAANLGDTDAMNEVARCYEEGFGGKKDKVSGSRLFWQLFFFSSLARLPFLSHPLEGVWGEGFHYLKFFFLGLEGSFFFFFLGQCAKEGFPKHEKPHTISFLFPSLFFQFQGEE